MGLKPGDTISTWITCSEPAESNIVHLACYQAGLKLIPLSSGQDLPQALSSSSALVFSPWEKFNSEYRIDHILSSVPELLKTPTGSLVKSSFKTKYFVQTGFKTIRGTYKLKTIPVYNGNSVNHPGFEINYKGNVVGTEAFAKFVDGIGKESGKVVVCALPCKSPLAIGSLVGNLVAGNKVVNAVMSDPGNAVNSFEASVLITSEEKLPQIKESCTVSKLILSLDNKSDLDRVSKLIEKKGVRAKSIVAYNSADLSNLV